MRLPFTQMCNRRIRRPPHADPNAFHSAEALLGERRIFSPLPITWLQF
jgi:hypothetical protein